MKFAILNSVARSKSSLQKRIEGEQCWWVQFGDAFLLYGANNKFDPALENMPKSVRQEQKPTKAKTKNTIDKGNMYLVVQKGRTFQLEHPKVPIILDKGRYLVVDLSKAKAAKLSKRIDPCFHIEPLNENTKVFETVAPKANARKPERQAVDLISNLQANDFEDYLTTLVSFPTRYSTSVHYAQAAAWASDQLNAMGLNSSIEPVSVPGSGQSSNVIARKIGTGDGERKNFIIGAHLDSVNHPGGTTANAPGADDNASGAAGVLCLAKAMVSSQFVHDITFVLFGGEEQGLHGSTQFLANMNADEKAATLGMLNMDMIGSVNTSPPSVLLEGADLSQSMIDNLVESASVHTSLEIQVSLNPFASDHVPFINAGIPAVLTIEGADSANDSIHTANDTIDRIDFGYATEILQMNLGFIADQASLADQASVDCGCPDTDIDATTAEQIRVLSGHYQSLFAQYSRLQRDGLINTDDIHSWQNAQATHDHLTNNL